MKTSAPPRLRARERGVSLIVVLVLILAMGLMAAFGIRASSTSSAVALSVRTQALAMEAAEAALRYCESQALSDAPAITIWDPPTDSATSRWSAPAHWAGTDKASATVPEDWLRVSAAQQAYTLRPECMVERLRLPGLAGTMRRETFLITARGFSPESSLRPDGRLRSGSEVWLQSTLEQ
jgi:type IV pilus assembly protein PilX